jgi:hypothetical protein
MIWRIAGGAILGLAIYWLLFLVLGISFGLLWSDYRDAARLMMQEQSFRLFTTPMFLTNNVVFAVAGAVAGWASTLISKTISSLQASSGSGVVKLKPGSNDPRANRTVPRNKHMQRREA